MSATQYFRPQTLQEALALMQAPAQVDDAASSSSDTSSSAWLAGGQSLLAAIKLGLAAPHTLVDVQDLPGLRAIRLEPDAQGQPSLWIGAMATHSSVAASEAVRAFAPGLAALAAGIADHQVRNMGTLGGSLAHNDPAACWPAGVLASCATITTSHREIACDDFFQSVYTTCLQPNELIVGLRFPKAMAMHYAKFEQKASRFALVGVAVARLHGSVRVAITGLGSGVVRWPAAEQALQSYWSVGAMPALQLGGVSSLPLALGDLHASVAYRAHLAWVLTRQAVAALTGEALPAYAPLEAKTVSLAGALHKPAGANQASDETKEGFGGEVHLQASAEQVWRGLLDPAVLQRCIPGCESLTQTGESSYLAQVKVGLGPLSVRFSSTVYLHDLQPPEALNMVFDGRAGALGSGQGKASVRLLRRPAGDAPDATQTTALQWWLQVHTMGRLAQLGTRLLEATARQLSTQFFDRLGQALAQAQPGFASSPAAQASQAPTPSLVRRIFQRLAALFKP
jgi:CO/xanthine dehydrogenase FAD-binding subunit/carbon monoxide dehydrogenase subunit G